MARKLFGTDGIRAVAGEYPLDDATVYAFGLALGEWAREHAEAPEVLIGMDTRESGPRLARIVTAALQEQKVKATFLGVITTPGVAYLTKHSPVVAGLMVSASHNPFQDNGLKLFGHSGYKLPDADELLLEERIFRHREAFQGLPELPELESREELCNAYLEHLRTTIDGRLDGMRLVLDCGNGAAAYLAPELFRSLGAEVTALHCEPNGRNINLGCGALHLEGLREEVLRLDADAGVAFDGDADRCMVIAKSGKLIDGDHTLLIAAKQLKSHGWLREGQAVVATVMSNLGLERALDRHGIRMVRTSVGDKYVLEEMMRIESPIGGEQSGHIIFSQFATTGDGMLTALQVLYAARQSGQGLDELTSEFTSYPQILLGIRVKEKKPLDQFVSIQTTIRAAESAFGKTGRINVRYSGTEPLARVMVEGADKQMVDEWAHKIADAIRSELA